MRHYVLYDEATGDILLHVKTNGAPPGGGNCVEADKEDCEGPEQVETTMRVNPRTKRLERKGTR